MGERASAAPSAEAQVSDTEKCSVQGCERVVHCKGLCQAHYQRQRYATDPEARRRKLASNHKWLGKGDNLNIALDLTAKWCARNRARKAVQRITINRYQRAQINPAALQREVARHLAKGRSLATIAVWTNQPLSVIAPIVDKLTAPPPPAAPSGTSADVPGTPAPTP